MSRRRTKGEQQREVVAWKLSGQSAAAFAAEREYSPSSLFRWAAGHSGRVPTRAKASSPEFVRIEVAEAPPAPRADLVVEVGDVRIRIGRDFDGALLREVVAVLRAPTVTR